VAARAKPENPAFVWADFVRLGVQKCEEVGSELPIFDTVGKFARVAAESEYSALQGAEVFDELDLARNKGISWSRQPGPQEATRTRSPHA
jgi:hypothetical protein